MERPAELLKNVQIVEQEIKATSAAVDSSKSVRLVCISKLKPASDVLALYEAGYRHFGENYVQELIAKARELPKDIQWHFTGGLQTNKCKDLAKNIDNLFSVETIDSAKKAKKLNDTRGEKPIVNVYIQVNTSGEDQKSGVKPGKDLEDLARVIVKECPKLKLLGLMTIGSFANSTSQKENQDFRTLSECREQLPPEFGQLELSMGMSNDYIQAIKQGADTVRVGTTIFGQRPQNNGH